MPMRTMVPNLASQRLSLLPTKPAEEPHAEGVDDVAHLPKVVLVASMGKS